VRQRKVKRRRECVGAVFDASLEIVQQKGNGGLDPCCLVVQGGDGGDTRRLAPAELAARGRFADLGKLLDSATERDEITRLALTEAEASSGIACLDVLGIVLESGMVYLGFDGRHGHHHTGAGSRMAGAGARARLQRGRYTAQNTDGVLEEDDHTRSRTGLATKARLPSARVGAVHGLAFLDRLEHRDLPDGRGIDREWVIRSPHVLVSEMTEASRPSFLLQKPQRWITSTALSRRGTASSYRVGRCSGTAMTTVTSSTARRSAPGS